MSDFVANFESLTEQIANIKKTSTDEILLKSFDHEEDFTGLCLDLLIETGSFVCITSCLYPTGKKGWTRDEAIIGGNFVRLYKLISAILDQTCQHRRETTFIFGRLAFETIVNLNYIIRFRSPELFESYIRYSLQHENKLLNLIQANISKRGGEVQAIEQRMINSILKMFKKSGIDSDNNSKVKIKNWGNKNLFDRAKAVDLDSVYLGAFGGGSHAVHGNWADILEYNLEIGEDGFNPKLDWRRPRPQILTTIAFLTVNLLQEYFSSAELSNLQSYFTASLDDLRNRIQVATEFHEQFLRK